VIAQVAVRAVREVLAVTPPDMVSTVVFNGHVDTVDPATGRRIQPPLISMRATRDKFDELGGIDCVAFRRDPVAPMKIAVQAKPYTKTVQPTHVRDLYGTMQHEGATLGIGTRKRRSNPAGGAAG
jgi:restriction endonuclease Mrr